ncbi:cell wall metabolism sensor histidine kinase WalK [Micromonospora sp. KC723]|uniref:sensor histidine kinase n=1 Tax=Micromonospora sp. KC723 TaxID=2530381 RepID=UPI0010477E4B|nr:HAMP domain-containing sensor histidine kinase [Micromonospora sp. KC723]TDB76750.1 HAMP domain-containing histidine kinase [Micromonospora sp. KC723]
MGVRLRLALAAAVVVAVALAVSAAIFIFVARLALIGNVDDAASQRAADVAAAVAGGDQQQVTQLLRSGPGDQTVVQVLDPAGRVEAASPVLTGEAPLSPLRPATGRSLREQRVLPVAGEDPFRIVATAVATAAGPRTVLVGQSLRPVNESVEVVTAVLVTGMPILLVVVGVATFWFVGRSLRPVEAIRSRVAGITARDLHARVPVPGTHDEVAALAETMNGMLDRLEVAARSQRRFVADASHELRSPLATIQAGLERLALTELPGSTGHHVQLMRRETERLGRLVSDLLLLARVDEHGLSPRREDVDLDDLAYTERNGLAVRHPDLLVRTQISPARVTGDAHDLGRALRNLTDNAARHARAEVVLRVWAEGPDGYLDVGDDGPGVPADERHRIFERFVRLDDSRSRADGGSGLGLAITREIVAAHGGTVTALPAGPGGGGLTVRIRLPLATHDRGGQP